MKKIMVVFGTRPEAIKLAPVIKELYRDKDHFLTTLVVTAQHREMLDKMLNLFGIHPDFDLNIMKKSQDLSYVSANILKKMYKLTQDVKPDLIIVQGDTTTSFIASLAGFYNRVKIAHVEAGLRSNNKYHPFPEEINRRLITHLTDLHFASTKAAKDNLIKEGINRKNIFVTGNTTVDSLYLALKIVNSQNFSPSGLGGLKIKNEKILLVTGHRRESFGAGFRNICYALKEIAKINQDISVIYPVHLNPNVQEPVNKILRNIHNIHLIAPLDYLSFVYLMNRCYLILTDSGGIQEEASNMGKPVIVMRQTTERTEGIKAVVAKLVGTDKSLICKTVQCLLENKGEYRRMSRRLHLYGDGKAAKRITQVLRKNIKIY